MSDKWLLPMLMAVLVAAAIAIFAAKLSGKRTHVQTNLLWNGSFEYGDLARWDIEESYAEVVRDTSSGRGEYALRFSDRSDSEANVTRVLSQQVRTSVAEAENEYQCVTWWARTEAPSGRASDLFFMVNDSGTTLVGKNVPADTESGRTPWVHYAATVRRAGTLDYERFAYERFAFKFRLIILYRGSVWLDEMAVTEGACSLPNGVVPSGASPR